MLKNWRRLQQQKLKKLLPTDTPEPKATNTPEPTATDVLTETPEPSATPLPDPAAIVGENGVSIYEGPGSVYGQAGTADADKEIEVLGQAYDCEWLEVRLIGVGQGWVTCKCRGTKCAL